MRVIRLRMHLKKMLPGEIIILLEGPDPVQGQISRSTNIRFKYLDCNLKQEVCYFSMPSSPAKWFEDL